MRTETLVSEYGTRTVYKYDDAGRQIRMTDYDTDGRITCDCFYQNNESGDVVAWKVLDGAGEMICRFEVDYDSQGLESELRQYDRGGKLVGRELYLYDSEGHRIVERNYVPEVQPPGEPAG